MIDSSRTQLLDNVKLFIENAAATANKDFFTIDEACKYLGVSRTMLYKLRKAGLIETKIIGIRKVVITKRSIDEFVRKAKSSYDTLIVYQ